MAPDLDPLKRDKLVIGTRGSKLALWQSNYIKAKVEAITGLPVELKIIKTTGDKILDVPLAKVGGKGLFTKEIEVELIDGTVDLAVHSMKDVPTELPEGLYIAAMPERVDPRDAIVSGASYDLDSLPQGAKLGHLVAAPPLAGQGAAPRPRDRGRPRQPRHPHAQGRERRARRGHPRLGGHHPHGLGRPHHPLHRSPTQMVSAVGQGAIGIEIREDDEFMRHVMARDRSSRDDGGGDRRARRHAPARGRLPGAHRRVRALRGRQARHGRTRGLGRRRRASCASVWRDLPASPIELGERMVERLLELGAGEILAEIRDADDVDGLLKT